MGSNIHLRKFQMTLELSEGAPKVIFLRIRESIAVSGLEVEATIDDESFS